MDKPDFGMTATEIKEELNKVRHPISVAVYGSENYFNAGAIIRTCHSFLVKEIFLIDCPVFYRKACMINPSFENITKIKSEEAFVEYMNSHLYRRLVAFEKRQLKSELLSLRTYQWQQDCIIMFGNEKFGLPDLLLEVADDVVTIEQYGVNNDLNISTCVGIALNDYITKLHSVFYGG